MKHFKLNTEFSSSSLLAWLQTNNLLLQSKSSKIITLILIAVTAWLLGQFVWLVLPEPKGTVMKWQPANIQVQPSQQLNTIDLTDILEANLFGKYTKQETIKPAITVIADAPKTTLNLILVGVSVSNIPQDSLAIITNNGKQNTIGVGEFVDGTNVELIAVLDDRVIIKNQGQDETLMLNGLQYQKLNNNTVSAQLDNDTTANANHNNANIINAIREELLSDPAKIFNYINIAPVQNGSTLEGYRVASGADNKYFELTGLKNGDIIKEINGIDLTDPNAISHVGPELQNASSFNLVIDRNGQSIDINI